LRPRRFIVAAALALLAWSARGADPQAFEIRFLQPVASQGLFGPTDVVLAATGANPVRLELYYNGARVGALHAPPWKFKVDTGTENIDRTFRAVAVSGAGEKSEIELVLPKLQVDEVVDLSLRQLYVTASRNGMPALDLGRDDFRILDGGDRQSLVTFERGEAPLAALLLIDSSFSMKGEPLKAAIEGARTFAAGMQPLDEAMLLLFSDRVVHSSPFTGSAAKLVAGLTGTEASGGSAINDHLFVALQLLEERQGRRVVILLSDGIDVESLLPAAQVLNVGQRSQAMVYWIRIATEPYEMRHRSPWRDLASHTEEMNRLADLVASSGGRRIDIPRFEDAPKAFAGILQELRQQYVLGYYPKRLKHDGVWREIEVQSAGVDLRTRTGYFDD
jgi:Ca-activated chloride channel family protein